MLYNIFAYSVLGVVDSGLKESGPEIVVGHYLTIRAYNAYFA